MQLPDFEFRSIVGPYAPAPIKEFGAATQALRADYEAAVENQSKLAQAKAAMRAANDRDQQVLDAINANTDEQLAAISQREDLENTLSQSKKLLNDYTTQITPIAQRTQQFDKFSNEVMQRDPINGARIIKAVQARENDPNQSSLKINPQTGMYTNTFNASTHADLMAPSVDLSKTLNQALAGVKADAVTYAPKIAQMTGRTADEVIDLIQNKSWEGIPDDVIKATAEAYLEGSADAQAYKRRESILEGMGLGNAYEDELTSAIQFATGKFAYDKTISSFSQLNTGSKTRGGKDSIPTLNTYGVSNAFRLDKTSVKDLRSSKKDLDTKAKDGELTSAESISYLAMQRIDEELHGEKGKIDQIAKNNGWTAADIELYMNNLDKSNEEVDGIVKGLQGKNITFGSTIGADFGPEENQLNAVKLQKLRSQVDDFAEKEFGDFIRKSYENDVINLTGEGKDKITEELALSLDNYYIIIQNKDGSTIQYQDYIDSLSKEERNRIEDKFETKPTSESLKQMLTATGVTKNSLIGFDAPAIRAKFITNYNDILGEEVYFVPKNKYDSELFTKVDQYLAKDAKTDAFRARNAFGNSGLDIESQFNAIRQFKPEAFKGKTFSVSSPLLDMQIESDGQAYIATMTAPDRSTIKVRATSAAALSDLYFINARKYQLYTKK